MSAESSNLSNIEYRAVIKYFVKKGKTPKEIFEDMVSVLQESARSCTMVKKWARLFQQGRESCEDDPRPGRPVTIAEELQISKERVGEIIHEHMNMRKISARWVPKMPTPFDKQRRLQTSKDFLKLVGDNIDEICDRIVTVDETWVRQYDPESKQESMQWTKKEKPKKFKALKATVITARPLIGVSGASGANAYTSRASYNFEENIAAGSERDPPTVETPEPAVLKPGLMHQCRRSNSAGPVMTPDKRTRDQLSPRTSAAWRVYPSYGSVEEGLDSTSYAYICSHGGEEDSSQHRPATPSHGPTSYAAAVSAPNHDPPHPSTHATSLRNKIQRTRNRKMIAHKRLPGEPKDTRHSGRISPNWTKHFSELRKFSDTRPTHAFKSGVRFLPATADEFRVTQRYLQSMSSKDPAITWYCYTPTNEQPTKVCVRGLPGDTNIQEILVALQQQDFPATYARRIPPRKDRFGCLFFVQLEHLNEEERTRLYAVKEILNMPGVTMVAWRDEAPCHRCQLFGHSSHNCHRPMRCVRCSGGHAAASCERPREEKPAPTVMARTRRMIGCPVFAEKHA
ncbi:Nucleic-acid-binding protein from transposon X-element [Eumeta japonica]|uniref:Nucleic-acid-binding protein from transposon X-element n=1 Tax=Eumeta variegata TaxID=151549 RepID=A0A4C1V4M4_EUMVA|nr:Nucleic-acid-binding protein from transposon X-element [Eumeta japonica]